MKNCNNCYWQQYKNQWCIHQLEQPKDNVCGKHSFECQSCESDKAEYLYEGKGYCSDCLLKEFEVEEYTTTNYYLDGEYLGSDNDIEEVISNLDNGILSLD